MASVSSLDQDMVKLRLERYTPEAANEVKAWIESTLGERLSSDDLLQSLRDGVILCRLANLVLPPPGIKFKASAMPFTQRENISQFLRVCELPPLNMPAHDRFLTVDLYDSKDPAQVLQCLGAFSRAANAIDPSRFPRVIGPRRPISPTRRLANGTGSSNSGGSHGHSRNFSNVSQGSATRSTTGRAMSPASTGGSSSPQFQDGGLKSPSGTVSSWSKKSDEGKTAPAWNIHQYGYMGGASQGNQGINFGVRRQITSAQAKVPSSVEKERARKEQEDEAERQRGHAMEDERRRRLELETQEERERVAEEEKWELETRRARERERQRVEEQRRQWEAEERRWKEEDEKRQREEEAVQATRAGSLEGIGNWQGQHLSQYQATQNWLPKTSVQNTPRRVSEMDRIRQLERQLEEAKERERQYELDREQRARHNGSPERPAQKQVQPSAAQSYRRPDSFSRLTSEDNAMALQERNYVQQQWSEHQKTSSASPRPLPKPEAAAFNRPPPQLEQPTQHFDARHTPTPEATEAPAKIQSNTFPLPSQPTPPPRPLPDASDRASPNTSSSPAANRTDRFPAKNPAPSPSQPRTHFPAELGMTPTSERAAEDARRVQSQQKTKAGGWASKSLLEREMERERERQREWEEAQMARGKGGTPGGSS